MTATASNLPAAQMLGAAGWILAAGLSLSLHIAAGSVLLMGLTEQPQAPAPPGPGIIVQTMPPETAVTPNRARHDPDHAIARQDALSPRNPIRAEAATETTPPAARPPPARRADPSERLAALPPSRNAEAAARNTVAEQTVAQSATKRAAPQAPRRIIPDASSARSVVLEPAQSPRAAATSRAQPLATITAQRQVTATRRTEPKGGRQPLRPAQAPESSQPQRLRPVAATSRKASNRSDGQTTAAVRAVSAPRRASRPAEPSGEAITPADASQPVAPAASQPAATSPRQAPAPLPRTATQPRDNEDPATRARRDGPDRRLTDRSAAPAGAGRDTALDRTFTDARRLIGAPCFLAYPGAADATGRNVALYGPDKGRLDAVRDRLADTFETQPRVVSHATGQAQCPALDFIRDADDDPLQGIALRLRNATASATQPLAGTVTHAWGQRVTLLLIDAAGRVHDLDRHLQRDTNASRFSIPLRRQGQPGDDTVLLLAVAAQTPPATLRRAREQPDAAPFFDALEKEIATQGMTPDLSLAAFVFN